MSESPASSRLARVVAAGLALTFAAAARPALAQSNDDCMACHEALGMTGTRDGKQINVTVDGKKLKASAHAKVECVSCHKDAKELPHEPGLKRVDCSTCHDKPVRDYRASSHGRAAAAGDATAPACFDCHGRSHQSSR